MKRIELSAGTIEYSDTGGPSMSKITSVTGAQQVRTFVDTNNHGTIRMIKAFVPLLRDGSASSWWPVRSAPWRAWT